MARSKQQQQQQKDFIWNKQGKHCVVGMCSDIFPWMNRQKRAQHTESQVQVVSCSTEAPLTSNVSVKGTLCSF